MKNLISLTAVEMLAALAVLAATAAPAPLQDKTLVAWVYVANTNQQGGSALTLMEGEDFDAMVFGERQPARWMAGSDFFRRTEGGQEQEANPPETASSNTLVQVAIAYAGNRISIFHNGRPYVAYAATQARSFGNNTTVLLGLRYLGEMGEIGFFSGAIEEARIYDMALSADQIAGLVPNKASDPKPLAWWTFEDGKTEDAMNGFPASRLEGNARVIDGKLVLDGSSYLWAARDEKLLRIAAEEETPFDASVQTLFYKARSKRTGNMWDTWLYQHQGDYYLYYLANARGQWDNISMARSSDGVHWTELGRVLSKGKGVTWMGTGSTWQSPHFDKDGKFFMNFSEWKGPRQTIFFAESKDLVHWTRLGDEYEFAQDERWYEKNGRWDCIWTIPHPGGGLYGYWTASPKAETGGRFGFGESLDGINWKALPPPKVPGVGEGEVGAIERIGDNYYMMFGTGGLMVTLVADRPEGPFLPAKKNFHLLAGHTYFSRFFPTSGGLLVNHHSIARDGKVYFGTLKAFVLDRDGTLRLGWWKGNQKLKHQAVKVESPELSGEIPRVATLEPGFDTRRGLVLEGTLKLPASRESLPLGLFLAQGSDSGTAILVHAGGNTELGFMRSDGTGFKAEQRVDREWEFGASTQFRLLLKGSLLEFYLNDLLMQCYSLPGLATGKIGLIQSGQAGGIGDLKAWECVAADASAAASSPSNPRPQEQPQPKAKPVPPASDLPNGSTTVPGPAADGKASDRVRFDFETGDLQGWKVTEGEFDNPVSKRAVFHNVYPEIPQNRYNKQGRFYLSTVEQKTGPSNDQMTGVIESPVFVLDAPSISFLIGGGDAETVYVALCTQDGKEILKARGRQTEIMERAQWSAPPLVGQKVFLRIVDASTDGWGHVTFDDFTAQGRIDEKATAEHFTKRRPILAAVTLGLSPDQSAGLRRAIQDLMTTFVGRYPRGAEFLGRLEQAEKRLHEDPDPEARAEFAELQREALMANPLVSGQPILFVVRPQYRSSYHAIDTLFHTDEANTGDFEGGGAMKLIDFSNGGKTRTVLEVPEGIARDPEVHFTGKKIVFSLRRHAREDWHIWEINSDGTGLRQLTSAPGVCDFDPLYLPDDTLLFSSTREPKYNQCSQDIAANLYRMESDGGNIHQLERNNLFNNQASLMDDGRILYARWEYVDRNFGDAHGLWTTTPDGVNHTIFWGNNTAVPGAAYTPRQIPGTEQVVCIFGPHHDHLWGAMAIVDRRLGVDGRNGVVRTWPAKAADYVRTGGGFDCDHSLSTKLKYADPYPLSDKYFLCSRMTGRAGEMGMFLVDVFGNEVLLHVEGHGCYDPMPLKPRTRPPQIASRRDFASAEGYFYVQDVYQGTHLQGVKRGVVKSLRVVEAPEKRTWSHGKWFGQGYTAPGMNWHGLENKRILGTVPVEADGSAYFAVPAEKFVYFQLLDADGMMVHSMRSGAMVQPGERTGCIGCHDHRLAAPPPALVTLSLALKRPPSKLVGWYGEPRSFGFTAEVQPIFTQHCLKCHDFGKEGAKKLVLAPDRDLTFNAAYIELWRKNYVRCVGAGPAEIQQAYAWGSHPSKLVQVLRAGHHDVKLSPEELDRIITWVDLNAPYYPTYNCAYPESVSGRCPLTRPQLARLCELVGPPLVWQGEGSAFNGFSGSPGVMVSFDRPELSPCLAKFEDKTNPKYREALALIQTGKEMLAIRPEADRPGFIACAEDQRREAKYAERRRIEQRNRQAIQSGNKAYDAKPSEPLE